MNLYEIDWELQKAVMDAIDPETGEIIDEALLKNVEALELKKDQKIENTCLLIKNLTAEAVALKAEKEVLGNRQKTAENRAASLKKYLQGFLQGEKFKSTRAVVSYRNTESVSVTDIKQIPESYLRYADPTADKVAIKEAIKAGIDIPGAEIVKNTSMSIK